MLGNTLAATKLLALILVPDDADYQNPHPSRLLVNVRVLARTSKVIDKCHSYIPGVLDVAVCQEFSQYLRNHAAFQVRTGLSRPPISTCSFN